MAITRGTATVILAYLQKNPDRIVTKTELMETFPQFDGQQISNAIHTLKRQHPEQVFNIAQGQYKYVSNVTVNADTKKEFIVRVVEEDATRLLVIDEDTNYLYVMTKLEW